MPKKTPESYVKKAVMDYLAAKKIFFVRMNSGQMLADYKGKTRRIAMGEKGTADIQVIRHSGYMYEARMTTGTWDVETFRLHHVIWLECKAEGSKQTPAQKEFEARVTAEGHRYAIVRSIDDVKELGL